MPFFCLDQKDKLELLVKLLNKEGINYGRFKVYLATTFSLNHNRFDYSGEFDYEGISRREMAALSWIPCGKLF